MAKRDEDMAADLEELLAIPEGRLDEALAEPRFRTPELCYRLLDHVAELAAQTPQAVAWPAQVAVRLAGRVSRRLLQRALRQWQSLDPDARGIARDDLLARLYCDGWLDVAADHRRHAAVLRERAELDEARHAIGEALRIYLGLEKAHLRGCAHAELARIHRAEEDFDGAVYEHLQALRLLERDLDPELFDRTVYRLGSSIRRSERLKPRAAAQLKEIRRRRYSRRELPWVQLRWVEDLVFLRLGQLDRALEGLARAPARLLGLGAPRDASLATLDVVDLHLAAEIRDDALAAARETLAGLRARDAEHGLVAAVERCAAALADGGGGGGLTEDLRAAILGDARPAAASPRRPG